MSILCFKILQFNVFYSLMLKYFHNSYTITLDQLMVDTGYLPKHKLVNYASSFEIFSQVFAAYFNCSGRDMDL